VVLVRLAMPAGLIHRKNLLNSLIPALSIKTGIRRWVWHFQTLFATAVWPPRLCFCLKDPLKVAKFNSRKKVGAIGSIELMVVMVVTVITTLNFLKSLIKRFLGMYYFRIWFLYLFFHLMNT
jgi:hypothetical protein